MAYVVIPRLSVSVAATAPLHRWHRKLSLCAPVAGIVRKGVMAKSSDKPKKQQKQKPQKTLKERRDEKRAAKKFGGSGSAA